MRFSTALVAAISLPSSFAFLVTPEISEISKIASDKIDAFTAQITGKSRSIDVKCHKCPLVLSYNATAKVLDVGDNENPIHLDFSTLAGQLQVNGATIFPLEQVNKQTASIHAHQTQPESGEIGATVPVEYAIAVQNLPGRKSHHRSEKLDTYQIDVTILGLAGTPVKAQTARVMLVDWDNTYYILNVKGTDFNPTAPGQNDLEMCQNAQNVQVCRVQMMLAQKVREMAMAARARLYTLKEWMKHHGPGNKPRPGMGQAKPCAGGSRPRLGYPAKFGHKGHQGHKFGHGQHHHHQQRPFGHHIWVIIGAFINVLLIPALIGALVGFTVSAIGMLVGNIISSLWARYRGRSNYMVVDQEIIVEEGEKEGLLVEGEAPPAYEYRDEVATAEKSDEVSRE